SSPAPPQAGGSPVDAVDGPQSLDIEFPTPDLEVSDSGPVSAPGPKAEGASADDVPSGVTVLPNKDVASLRSTLGKDSPPRPATGNDQAPRSSERPPPPSQRLAQQPRVESSPSPVPPSLPAPVTTTLPAPAPLHHPPPAVAQP